MLLGGNHVLCKIYYTFPVLDLHCTDSAQHFIPVGLGSKVDDLSDLEVLDDLSDMSDVWAARNLQGRESAVSGTATSQNRGRINGKILFLVSRSCFSRAIP